MTDRRDQAPDIRDLEALRRTEPAPRNGPARPWLPRLTIGVLVVGALAVVFAMLRPVLFPPREVTLRAVRVVGDAQGTTSASAVQAACWIEADPYPTTVRPLVRGIVESLEVVEGTPVTKDKTLIAVLRNLDLENALEAAKADAAVRKAEHAAATTALDVAMSLLEQKIELRAATAALAGELSVARAAVDGARAQRKAAEAALEKAQVDLLAQQDLEKAGHGTPTALRTAAAAVKVAEERVKQLRFEEVRLVADLGRISELLSLAREVEKDPRDLQGRVDSAQREADRAKAAHDEALTMQSIAQRNVDHLQVRSPDDGIVLRLECAPGALVGPQGEFKGAGEGAGSTGQLNRLTGTLVSLYDPQRLQARVDVPFADLPGIETETRVEITAKALPGRKFEGRVDRLVREADITQAKLQVKVRVEDPDALLRPEMLGTARFFIEAKASGGERPSSAARVLVPTEALRGDAVFVLDPRGGGKARRVSVRVLGRDGEWTEVEGALGASAKVILEAVEDGEPVRGKP